MPVMAALVLVAIVSACIPEAPPRQKLEPEPDFWWREASMARGNDRGAKENWSTAHESRRKGEGSDFDYGATESGFRGPYYAGGENPEESVTGQEGSGCGHRHSGKAERLITAKTSVLTASKSSSPDSGRIHGGSRWCGSLRLRQEGV
jgi:hypothetical protein